MIRRSLIVAVVATFLLTPAALLAAGWPDWASEELREFCMECYETDDAVIVLDSWELKLKGGKRAGTRRRIVQVLTDDGRDAATLSLPSWEFETYSRARVWVRDPTGGLSSFSDEDGTLLGVSDVSSMQDSEVLYLEPRGLVPGSTVAIEHRFEYTADLPQDLFGIQESHPVARAVISVDARGGWEVRAKVTHGENPGAASTAGEATWEFTEIDAEASTEGGLSPLPPRTRLALDYVAPDGPTPFATWASTSKWVSRLFRVSAGDTPRLDAAAPAGVDDRAEYVDRAGEMARDIRYFAINLGWGGWVPRAPETTLRRAFGDCKDKAQLMIATLARQGIDAYPVLAMAASRGNVPEDLPSPFLFNHAIVGIPWSDLPRAPGMALMEDRHLGTLRLYDATLPSGSTQDISLSLEGGFGLVLHPSTDGLIRFPGSSEEDNVSEILYTIRVGDDGSAAFRAVHRTHGLMRAWLQGDDGGMRTASELRSEAFEEASRGGSGVTAVTAEGVRIADDGSWSYEYGWESADVMPRFGRFRTLELGQLANESSLALPDADGDAVHQPFQGTFRETHVVEHPAVLLAAGPESFEVENELGRVRLEFVDEGETCRVERSVALTAREVTADQRQAVLELRRAIRRANGAVLLFESADTRAGG